MRVAICHDYLNQLGGAERVLEVLLEIFPGADLYTLFHDPKATQDKFATRITKASFLNHDLVRRRHRFFIPFFPLAAFFLRGKTEYDLIISSSAGYGKSFRVKAKKHICYCHTPLRYAWEKDYILSLPHSLALKIFLYLMSFPLCLWDFFTARKPDLFLANSEFIRAKINKFYRREATVLYPPVETGNFYPTYTGTSEMDHDFYLAVGRFVPYKAFDVAIKAVELAGRRLVIVGSGFDEARLREMSSKFVKFTGWMPDTHLRRLYNTAKALIFPQIEDFGLVAAEAQMCGLPVIAYKRGGVLEIVEPEITGVFFDIQTPEALAEAIAIFESKKFDRKLIADRACRFSEEVFKNTIKRYAGCP